MSQEIRPLIGEEVSLGLDLVCICFGLNRKRIQTLFDSDLMRETKTHWGLFEGRDLLSTITVTPLQFGWGEAAGISGVATHPDRQKQGLASCLLKETAAQESAAGRVGSILLANEARVYEKAGYSVTDRVIDGTIMTSEPVDQAADVSDEETEQLYAEWAEADPGRMRRDETRWRAWRWLGRRYERLSQGVACCEPGLVREAVLNETLDRWPLPAGTRWVGLKSIADQMGVPLQSTRDDLLLMSKDIPGPVQLFLTDQF